MEEEAASCRASRCRRWRTRRPITQLPFRCCHRLSWIQQTRWPHLRLGLGWANFSPIAFRGSSRLEGLLAGAGGPTLGGGGPGYSLEVLPEVEAELTLMQPQYFHRLLRLPAAIDAARVGDRRLPRGSATADALLFGGGGAASDRFGGSTWLELP